jgi:hypothetical protein
VFGAHPTENAGKNLPGLWVEQDLFYTRKISWPSESELTVEELGTYPRNLYLPQDEEPSLGKPVGPNADPFCCRKVPGHPTSSAFKS